MDSNLLLYLPFYGYKTGRQPIFTPSSFVLLLDPGWTKIRIRYTQQLDETLPPSKFV